MVKYISDKYPLITDETDKEAVVFYRNYGSKITSLGEKYPGVERFLGSIKNNDLIERV